MSLWNPEWDPVAPLFVVLWTPNWKYCYKNMCTYIFICAQYVYKILLFIHGHVWKWQEFDLILPQALAFTSNNKYDKHALLCLQLITGTCVSVNNACSGLSPSLTTLYHFQIATCLHLPKTCPWTKACLTLVWSEGFPSTYHVSNATDRNASGYLLRKLA